MSDDTGEHRCYIGVDETGRAVTALVAGMKGEGKELAKWLREGLTVHPATVRHARVILSEKWRPEALQDAASP